MLHFNQKKTLAKRLSSWLENIIELLENNGFETIATILAGSDGWRNAINAYLAEQNKHRNEF